MLLQDSLLQWAGGDLGSESAEQLWTMPEKGSPISIVLCERLEAGTPYRGFAWKAELHQDPSMDQVSGEKEK